MRIQVTLKRDPQGWTVTHNGSRRAVRYPQMLRALTLNHAENTPQHVFVDEALYHGMYQADACQRLLDTYPGLFGATTIRDTPEYGPECPCSGGYMSIPEHKHTVMIKQRWVTVGGMVSTYECPVCHYSIDASRVEGGNQ